MCQMVCIEELHEKLRLYGYHLQRARIPLISRSADISSVQQPVAITSKLRCRLTINWLSHSSCYSYCLSVKDLRTVIVQYLKECVLVIQRSKISYDDRLFWHFIQNFISRSFMLRSFSSKMTERQGKFSPDAFISFRNTFSSVMSKLVFHWYLKWAPPTAKFQRYH
jgi:hypothetical protein